MARIPLCNKRGKRIAWTLVDDADFDALSEWRWYLDTSTGYASRNVLLPDGRRRLVRLHRQILGLERGDKREGDHRNRNKLDNQRSNLRVTEPRQNKQNVPKRRGKRGARGAFWDKSRKKWLAAVRLDGVQYNLGRYETEKEAAEVAAAFRRKNMPFSTDDQLDATTTSDK